MSSQTDSGTSADAAVLYDSFRSSACEQVASAGAARVHAHSPKMHEFVCCGSLLHFSVHAAEACSFGELPRSTATGWQGPFRGPGSASACCPHWPLAAFRNERAPE